MKRCRGCSKFVNPFKTVAHSNSGREMEKILRENFCVKHHTEVDPGCVCRFCTMVKTEEAEDE